MVVLWATLDLGAISAEAKADSSVVRVKPARK